MKRKTCLILSIILFALLGISAFAASGDTLVYITDTGEKYHSYGCQYLAKSCIEVTLDNAVKWGYEPCSRCYPPALDEPSRSVPVSVPVQAETPAPSHASTPIPAPTLKPLPSPWPTLNPPPNLNQDPVPTLTPKPGKVKKTTENDIGTRLIIGIPSGVLLLLIFYGIALNLYERITDKRQNKKR